MKKATGGNEGSVKMAEVGVADRLAALRGDQGMTLQELGAKVGLSSAYLSRIENHKTAVTIANLSRLATALGVSMASFFQDDPKERQLTVCLTGRGKIVRLRGEARIKTAILAGEKKGKLMEPIIVDIGSAKQPMDLRSHPGEEFNYVLEGKCEFIYAKERLILGEGDSIYYDATVPHAVRAEAGEACRILSVVASKDYLFHGDLTRLLND